MTALLEIDTNVDSESLSIFFKIYDEDKDKKLRFSDFSKAFLPLIKEDAELILKREARNMKRDKHIK
jgi:hypothetical protein